MNSLFNFSPRALELQQRLAAFMAAHVYPAEQEIAAWDADSSKRWTTAPIIETLKAEAKKAGLWNLFLPPQKGESGYGAGLSNLDYAPLAEQMGRVLWASEVFNCNAPDTGNMELLAHFADAEQKAKWLTPLLNGDIRSAFAMTEPDVASSDATNIALRIHRDENHYVLNGRKWWITGAGDPRCKILIVMGVTNPEADKHSQHSMILVPMDTPGLQVVRALEAFGFDDAPSGHVELNFDNVRVPKENLIQTEGSGFALAQARLGPGRIHHCMRLIGLAQRALEMMIHRAQTRVAFGKPLGAQGMAQEAIALSRCEIEQARLLTLNAAAALDQGSNKTAKDEIGMIKIIAPRMACNVIDRAIQMHGAGGLQDPFLAHAFVGARCLRMADGPDEVHIASLARSMLKP
ncbi:MAG: acyl-CoA dehydrogenase family protein [Arenimonas sp.]